MSQVHPVLYFNAISHAFTTVPFPAAPRAIARSRIEIFFSFDKPLGRREIRGTRARGAPPETRMRLPVPARSRFIQLTASQLLALTFLTQ